MNLRYDMRTANDLGENRHPCVVMRDLGVVYDRSESITIADCWVFFDCTQLPQGLPLYLTETVIRPS